jgi:hypothetical protein
MKKNNKKLKYLFLLLIPLLFLTGCMENTGTPTKYNISQYSEEEGPVKLIKTANYWTDDAYIIMFLIGLLFVSYISLKQVTSVKRAIASSVFITMLSSFIIRMLDIAKNNSTLDKLVFGSMVLFIFAALALYFDREEIAY